MKTGHAWIRLMSTRGRVVALAALGLLITQSLALLAFGRPPLCACGSLGVWYGAAAGPETSQHLLDPYSLTHVEHGLLFALLLRSAFPRATIGRLFLAAILLESAWEIIENTPFIIERYRQTALAAGYVGDSVVNALGDTLSMMVEFAVASRATKRNVAIALILFEIALAFGMKDNLTLTLVQLVHPVAAIDAWQTGS